MKVFDFFNGLFGLLLGIPLLFLAGLYALISWPFNFIRYRNSHYFKDLREKYSLFTFYSDRYSLYNLSRERQIPLTMVQTGNPINTYGYFVHGQSLIVTDITGIYYDEERNAWGIEEGEEESDTGEFIRLDSLLADAVQTAQQALQNQVPYRPVALVDADTLSPGEEPYARNNKMFLIYDDQNAPQQISDYLRIEDGDAES